MSFQPTEKEKSLAELMARVLKEPLKPLDKSMADLNGELSEIKQLADDSAGTLSLCLENAEGAFKQSKEAAKLSRSLQDEHLPALKSSIAQHVQDGAEAVQAQLSSYADRSASALEAVAKDVLSALDGVNQEQRSTAQTIEALPAHLSHVSGELSDIKQLADDSAGTLSLCLENAEGAFKQSKEAAKLSRSLQDEHLPALKSSIAQHVQDGAEAVQAQLSSYADRSASALEAVAKDVLSALDGVNQEQRSTAQTIEALPAHISQELGITNASLEDLGQTLQDQIRQSQALVDAAIARAQAQLESTSSAIALGLKSTTGRISQLVMHQQRTAQAAHQAMFSEMRDAATQAQAATEENVQTGQALNESLSARHDELVAAFANHTEALNARLDQSQAKVRNLTITTGVLLVLMAVYVAYGLLGHLS